MCGDIAQVRLFRNKVNRTAKQCVCEKNVSRLKSLHLVNRRYVNGGDIFNKKLDISICH